MRSIHFFFAVAVSWVTIAPSSILAARSAEQAFDTGWLRQSPTRTRLSLNGAWEWKREGEDAWQSTDVPAAFDFVGEVSLRRWFEVDSTVADRSFLLVGWGINYHAVVTVNGKFVGSHAGYYSGFEIEVPSSLIRFGPANEIVVTVTNRLDPRTSLPLKHQPLAPRNFGGLLREIFLFAVPPDRVQSARTRMSFTEDFSRCALTISATLKRQRLDGSDLRCGAEVWDPLNQKLVARSEPIRVDFADRVSADAELALEVETPRLWRLNDPFLYELRLKIWKGDSLTDEIRQPLGLRRLAVTSAGIELNGQTLAATGVDWVEGYGTSGSPLASPEEMQQRIARVKELGGRLLRVVAHPPHPYVLDLTDRAGILVLLEIPLRGVPSRMLHRQEMVETATRRLETLILQTGQHPSVAAWGLGYALNAGLRVTAGEEESDAALRLLEALRETARGLDDRPLYYVARTATEVERPLPVDLVILDMFERSPAALLRQFAAVNDRASSQPLLVQLGYSLRPEVGAGLGAMDPQIEVQEHQAYRLQRAMDRTRESGIAVGLTITALTDWPAATPLLTAAAGPDQRTVSAGLISPAGEKRVSFALVQADFTGDIRPHISQVAEEVWQPTLLPVLGLALMLAFAFFFNRDRRLRGHLRRVFVHPHGFYQELRELRKIPPSLTTLLMTLEVVGVAALVTSALLPFRESLVFDEFVSLLLPAVWLKSSFIWLMGQSFVMVAVWSLLILLGVTGIAVYLWLIGLTVGRPLPFGQLFTLVIWAGANYLWMLIVVPVFYRLMQTPGWREAAVVLFMASATWFGARLVRAVRAVYFLGFVRAVVLVAGGALAVLVTVVVYYERTQALLAYIPYYWTLIHHL